MMWVITICENEKFLGYVIEKKSNQIHTQCLEKLLALNDSPNLAREEDAVYSNYVFKTNINPVLMQVDASEKKDTNGIGCTNNIIGTILFNSMYHLNANFSKLN